ncbi:MAG TPA: nucleotide sugar dehydrogenase [Dehalococcoidia bacterium]|nr:nucleotide sugar dehydrogenase [Dehalococcoidia bacterium]
MRVLVAGGGYVGLSTATGFARQGHGIEVIEIDPIRAEMLREGRLPFQEPSLAGAFHHEVERGSITIHTGYHTLHGKADFAFICTSTPPTADGSLDTSQVFQAAEMLIEACDAPLRLIIRSTVNPGTAQQLEEKIGLGQGIQVLANPEFLREGSGLNDFESPSRIVIGGSDAEAVDALARLYTFAVGVPLLRSNAKTAELIKLTSNAALAVRVSMANEIAHLAEADNADVDLLLEGVGWDPRIGQDYLKPGIGFGGSCLPKDLAAFRAAAQQTGFSTPVFDGASLTNDTVVGRLASRAIEIASHIPQPRVCVVGVGFKPGSDSLRSSQAVRLVRTLLLRGVSVTLYDQLAESNARHEFGDRVSYAETFEAGLADADVTVLLDRSLVKPAATASEGVIIDALGRQVSLAKSEGAKVYGRR